MAIKFDQQPSSFCWLDLAAANARAAEKFYADMFGWQTQRKQTNGGEYVQFVRGGESFASVYQLEARQIDAGVPSHWTPYIAVSDVHEMGSRAKALGGQVIVNPFDVDGLARLSLIADSAGALIGLWERAK
jgi:predicted enzyme related to lactoylglutathione lyase